MSVQRSTVESTANYGGDDTLFFGYTILCRQGGIAHCPTQGPRGYYDDGAHGALGGRWYWGTDD